jgi:hypothetical protein
MVMIGIWIAKAASTSTSPRTERAKAYISHHGTDAATVQAVVEDAIGVMALTVNSSTTSNASYLVRMARAAGSIIGNVRIHLAGDQQSGVLRSEETAVLIATIDLKRTMGALVAYTAGGFRSPLADLTSRYDRARREWNDAVQRIWSAAQQQSAPSIP